MNRFSLLGETGAPVVEGSRGTLGVAATLAEKVAEVQLGRLRRGEGTTLGNSHTVRGWGLSIFSGNHNFRISNAKD